jgi:hypothetical protein
MTLWAIKGRDKNFQKHMTKYEVEKLRNEMLYEAIKDLNKRLDYLESKWERVIELRREIRETREDFSKFTEVTASTVARSLIEPLIKSLVSQYGGVLPPAIEE